MNTSAIIFIHGLGGNGKKTWGSFQELITSDPDLRKFDVLFFNYPTSLFPLPFSKKYPKIQALAKALKTQIDEVYSKYTDIILVCHSLGGLIAKKYIVNEAHSNTTTRVRALALYATPNNGSSLANISKHISWRHNQLKQLCKDSDLIEDLNEAWFQLNIERKIHTNYIVAALDKVVDPTSAQSHYGNDEVRVIADKGHIDIVKPTNKHDTSFILLKNIAMNIDREPADSYDDIKPYITPSCRTPLTDLRKNLRYKLIAFDADGTLLKGIEFSWTRIWQYLGFPESLYKEGMRRYRNKETTYEEWCTWACRQYRSKSLKKDQFTDITKDITVTKNFQEAIDILRNDGFILAIISGGVDSFLYEKIPNARELFDYIFINQFIYDDQEIVSGVNATPFDFKGKAIALERICKRHGFSLSEAVFVGEGFNDSYAAKKAGLSIAYPPNSQSFNSIARIAIKKDDLLEILAHVN